MTELPTAVPTDDAAQPPAVEVEAVLRTLSRALRAFQMYEANNPVFQRFEEALRRDFEALWEEASELELGVSEEGFVYGDRVFTVGQGRQSLAFAFYKDGVRYLKFLPGFEDEVGAFVETIRRTRRSDDDDQDMISVLWEGDFASLQYGYVDALSEGVPLPEGGGEVPATVTQVAEAEPDLDDADLWEASGGAISSTVSAEDFDATLYFLDPAEMASLRREVEVEMERDVRSDVLSALFDRLEEATDRPARQTEIMEILDQLLPLFLGRGQMGNAARVLEELDRLATAEDVREGPLAERIDRLFRRLGETDVLEQFIRAMQDGEISPSADEVGLFFRRLPAEALPVLLRFSEGPATTSIRERLTAAIDGLAERHAGALVDLLGGDDVALVKGAARSAGRVGMSQAVPALKQALGHRDPGVRLAVVEALVAIRLTPALHALATALNDPDREVRIAAARGLGAVRFASARDALASALEARRMKEADLTEKMAFYEAYGAVGGSAAVEHLDRVLNNRGFLGRRSPAELRACAALGLGKVGTAAAREALEQSRHDEDPVVRNAVLRGLREAPA